MTSRAKAHRKIAVSPTPLRKRRTVLPGSACLVKAHREIAVSIHPCTRGDPCCLGRRVWPRRTARSRFQSPPLRERRSIHQCGGHGNSDFVGTGSCGVAGAAGAAPTSALASSSPTCSIPMTIRADTTARPPAPGVESLPQARPPPVLCQGQDLAGGLRGQPAETLRPEFPPRVPVGLQPTDAKPGPTFLKRFCGFHKP
jgi:hypothetical protein